MTTARLCCSLQPRPRKLVSNFSRRYVRAFVIGYWLTYCKEDLARISLRPGPLYINVDEEQQFSTVDGLEQGYVLCDADKRFILLFSFLRRMKAKKKKVIVFFSSCNSVKYYSELLNYIDCPVLDLHGKQKQQKRTNTFFEFSNAEHGILICTDVAARGLDVSEMLKATCCLGGC